MLFVGRQREGGRGREGRRGHRRVECSARPVGGVNRSIHVFLRFFTVANGRNYGSRSSYEYTAVRRSKRCDSYLRRQALFCSSWLFSCVHVLLLFSFPLLLYFSSPTVLF